MVLCKRFKYEGEKRGTINIKRGICVVHTTGRGWGGLRKKKKTLFQYRGPPLCLGGQWVCKF